MKKLFTLLASALMIFTGCAGKDNSGASNNTAKSDWRLVSIYNTYEEEKNGAFVLTGDSRLDFLDFGSMTETPVCGNAACRHEADSDCPAYSRSDHPFLYGGKLLCFRGMEIETDENGLIRSGTQLWESDIGGGNEKLLCEWKGLALHVYDKILLSHDKLWIILTDEPSSIDQETMQTVEHPAHQELVCFDLKTNTSKNYGKLTDDHYSTGYLVYGEWDGRLIFACSHSKDDRPYMERAREYIEQHPEMKETEAWEAYSAAAEYVYDYYEVDISNGEIKALTSPKPLGISCSAYYFNEGGKLKRLTKAGETKELGDAPDSDVLVMNGYVNYIRGGRICLLNEATLEEAVIDTGESTLEWIDGDDLILRSRRIDQNKETGMTEEIIEYQKKPIAELMK